MRFLFPHGPLLPLLDADDGKDAAATTGNDAGDKGDGTTDPKQPFASFPDEKSFTARINREAKSHLEAKAKELGFDNAAAMEAAVKAAKEHADSQKTELQKAQERATELETASKQTLTQVNQRLVTAEAKVQATALGIKPERVASALKLADLSKVEIGDDGEPDAAAIKVALEAVIADIPELKGSTAANVGGGSNPPGGGNTGKINIAALDDKAFADLQQRVLRGERIEV